MLAGIVITLVKRKSKSYFKKLLGKDINSSKEITANIKDKTSLKCIFKKSFFKILLNVLTLHFIFGSFTSFLESLLVLLLSQPGLLLTEI